MRALNSTQFGAIENRSAIDVLFAITHSSSKALLTLTISNSGKLRPDRPTLLAYDIRGAFNNTDPARLVHIMEAWQMPAYLSQWVASFATNRPLAFCFGSKAKSPQPYNSGLPLGFPVSPVLFLIYA